MIELSELKDALRRSAADSSIRLDDANKTALHFMFGVQRIALEEMVFAAYATLDGYELKLICLVNSPRSLGQHIRFRIGRRWVANAVSISSNSSSARAIGCSGMEGD